MRRSPRCSRKCAAIAHSIKDCIQNVIYCIEKAMNEEMEAEHLFFLLNRYRLRVIYAKWIFYNCSSMLRCIKKIEESCRYSERIRKVDKKCYRIKQILPMLGNEYFAVDQNGQEIEKPYAKNYFISKNIENLGFHPLNQLSFGTKKEKILNIRLKKRKNQKINSK